MYKKDETSLKKFQCSIGEVAKLEYTQNGNEVIAMD